MDSSASAPRNTANPRTLTSMEKLQAMVTPEQVHSASIAKKRRTITRKRTNDLSKARSQTPIRSQHPDDISTDDDEPRKQPSVGGDIPDKESYSKQSESLPKQASLRNAQPPKVPEVPDEVALTKQPPEVVPSTGEVLKKTAPLKLAAVPSDEDPDEAEVNISQANNMPVIGEGPEPVERQAGNVGTLPYPEPPVAAQRRNKKRPESASISNSESQSIISDHGPDVSTEVRSQRASSIPKQLEEQIQKFDQFVAINTQELKQLFHRAKNTVEEKSKELRRRKFKKPEDAKRSRSHPKQLTEQELMDSFKRAQRAITEREDKRKRSLSLRSYSLEREESQSPEKSEPKRPNRKRGVLQEIVKMKEDEMIVENQKGRRMKDQVKCNKIVEVLDPKTSKVIEVKDVGEVTRMRVLDAFKIFRFYTIWEIRKEYRKYKTDMNDECKLIRQMQKKCFIHILILLIFCGLGGMTFKFIEGAFENFYKCGVKRVKRDFIDLLWMKSHNLREDEWKSLARNRLRIFEEELHTAHEAGLQSYSGQRSWSFLNGIVYCLTIVTTIGYGHLYPTTKTGQALTIVYSLIGIPLFLIILTDFGKLFTRCIKFLWSFVRRLYYTGSCRSIRNTTQAQEIFKGAQMMYEIATFRRPSTIDPSIQPTGNLGAPSPQGSVEGTTAPSTPAISNFEIDDEFNLPISVAILLLVLYIFLGAVLFGIWEGWDFFASFYFVFISMSTIGFGDYVPRHPIFMIVSIVYLVFGLALMTMCINVVQVKLSDTFNRASDKIGATIGLSLAQEDNSINTLPPKQVEMPQVHGSLMDLNKLGPDTSSQ